MKPRTNQFGRRRTITFRLGSYACAVLGLLWALSPLLHGVFHLAELPHQHSAESVHSHDHYRHDPHTHSDGHSHDHHDHSASEGHSHDESSEPSHEHFASNKDPGSDTVREADTEKKSDQENQDHPGPLDDGSGAFFLVLDIATTNSIALEIALSESSPPLDSVAREELEVFSATLIGSGSPRGPPV